MESLGMSPGALPFGGPGFPVSKSFSQVLGIPHSPAQDGVLLPNGACSVCFLHQTLDITAQGLSVKLQPLLVLWGGVVPGWPPLVCQVRWHTQSGSWDSQSVRRRLPPHVVTRPWTSSRLGVSRRDFGDPLWILCHLLSTPKRHSQDPCREFSAKWHSVAHWSVTRKAFIQHDASWPHDSLLWKQEVTSHESLFFSDDCFFGDRTAWDF